ncbi:OmpP1/FadL family transporter, partial [Desulfosarcina sp.]|uniref:OmpP1/FadL family transporter n=1 Tax=Desulfosarcina sp. TaxID=2027861 RepID=UPI0029A366F0
LVLAVVTISCVLLFSGSAAGSGFAIIEQSAASAGYAYAGAAAAAQDVSTIFFNPAGMALLSGQNELQLGAHYIIPKADFANQGSTTVLGTPLTGGNGGDGGEPALVPNLYYMHSFSEKWKAGIGITAPYGLVTEYDNGWVGRYYAIKSELATLNINPSVAYKINDQWSLGVGVSFERAEAELTNAIDWGTALVSQGLAPPGTSQNLDGTVKVEGDDWGYGANVGLIFEPRNGTRLGLHYRSQIDHTLEGDATFNTPAPAAPLAAAVGRVNTGVTADVDLPETVSFSGYHAFNERWAILADATWTKWSRLEELRVKYNNGAADSVDTLAWDDTWRFSLGGTFKPMEALELRAGVAFDETPIPSEQRRTVRIPGADRTWLTFGAGYQFSKLIKVDFAYGHLWVDDPKINKDPTEPENRLKGGLIGEYDASVDIISAAVSFQF